MTKKFKEATQEKAATATQETQTDEKSKTPEPPPVTPTNHILVEKKDSNGSTRFCESYIK